MHASKVTHSSSRIQGGGGGGEKGSREENFCAEWNKETNGNEMETYRGDDIDKKKLYEHWSGNNVIKE
jgi:hypothetical protein